MATEAISHLAGTRGLPAAEYRTHWTCVGSQRRTRRDRAAEDGIEQRRSPGMPDSQSDWRQAEVPRLRPHLVRVGPPRRRIRHRQRPRRRGIPRPHPRQRPTHLVRRAGQVWRKPRDRQQVLAAWKVARETRVRPKAVRDLCQPRARRDQRRRPVPGRQQRRDRRSTRSRPRPDTRTPRAGRHLRNLSVAVRGLDAVRQGGPLGDRWPTVARADRQMHRLEPLVFGDPSKRSVHSRVSVLADPFRKRRARKLARRSGIPIASLRNGPSDRGHPLTAE